MYNALIVDDEKSILENIQKAIPWEELGIETVFTAQNGSDALSLLEAYHIDLLISDIRMPGMDGLTLLKHVRDVYPNIRCILLSAYGEFEYARTALTLGIENYLLKPLSVEELIASIQKSLDNLAQSKHIDQNLFHDNILLRWITGTISEDELVERTPVLNINLYSRNYSVILLHQSQHHNLLPLSSKLETELKKDYTVYSLAQDNDNRILILASHEINAIRLCRQVQHVLDTANASKDVIAAVGSVISGSAELSRSYSDAKSTLQYAKLFSSMQVIAFEETFTSRINPLSQSRVQNILASDTVEAAISSGKILFDDLFNLASTSREVHDLASEIGATIIAKAMDELPQGTFSQLNATLSERCGPLAQYPEKTSYYTWLETLITETWLLYHSQTGSISPIVSQALRYIKENFSASVSIKEFCNQFDINASYLGYLFKTETGVFFNDYVSQVRINNAMLLLENTHKKIAEIAERVGFSNVSYFIKCFRGHTGISPAKYRQNKLAESATLQKGTFK